MVLPATFEVCIIFSLPHATSTTRLFLHGTPASTLLPYTYPPINPLFLSFYFSPKNKQFPPNHTLTMSTPNINNEYMPVFPSSNAAAVLDERVRKFIADFYATSDDKARNEEWVACFAPDAVVVMGERRARGREGVCSFLPSYLPTYLLHLVMCSFCFGVFFCFWGWSFFFLLTKGNKYRDPPPARGHVGAHHEAEAQAGEGVSGFVWGRGRGWGWRRR